MRVLLVEDEAKLARLLQRGLREEQINADVATNGQDGLWLAGEHPYDVLVLDVMLPDVDGIEVCRRIRAGDDLTPVLMLTAVCAPSPVVAPYAAPRCSPSATSRSTWRRGGCTGGRPRWR
jgi:DNA-binding response OmpR family regulator